MNSDIKLLSSYVDNVTTKNELYDIPWKIFYDKNKKCRGECSKNINVLILNTPCMGFGDIVYGMKLSQYIKEWYKCKVTIATTQTDKFIQLGESKDNLLLLKGNKKSQCRRFKYLDIYNFNEKKIKLPIYDLIFVAPLTADFDPDYKDVKSLIPYSNRFNTFFFSEYNDTLSKDIDFHTGVGDNRLGLFLTKITSKGKLPQIKNRYSVIYIAETIDGSDNCFLSFIEMVAKKYCKMYNNFDIVVPEWIVKNINKYKKKLIKLIKPYYDNIVLISKTEDNYILEDDDNNKTINIRGDILPLQNKDMTRLIKYSVRDILLTGDQSITDALSCCSSEKNIFYQIAPWKRNFGKNLSTQLPNKFLSKKTTSCGTIHAIKYHSDYKKFIKKWDFRKIARGKMDSIFLSAANRQKNNTILEFEKLIIESKSLSSFDKNFDRWIET
jgi:hypothetical protein